MLSRFFAVGLFVILANPRCEIGALKAMETAATVERMKEFQTVLLIQDMQSNGSFYISKKDLFKCVQSAVEWIQGNLDTNTELNRFQDEAFEFNINSFARKSISKN